MKLRSSHLVAGILAVVAVIFVLALVRSSQAPPAEPGASNTDKFLSQVDRIRESGGGSRQETGLVPSAEVDLTKREELQFSESPVEMGTIPNDKIAEKHITVKNPGGLPIDVLDIRTSCGCTQGKFEESTVGPDGRRTSTIQPHSEATLIVTVDPAGVHGFHSRKMLTLMTNDPVNSQYQLVVAAHIEQEFVLEPEEIRFGTVQAGIPAEVHIVIRQVTDEPMDINAAQVPNAPPVKGEPPTEPKITLELGKRPEAEWKTPGHQEWDLFVRLKPDAPVGDIEEEVWLVTNLKRVTDLTFRVTGKSVTFYNVAPANLGARNVAKPGDTRVSKATVSAGVPITVSDATVSGSDVTLEVVPQSNGKQVDIYLNVSPDAAPGLKNEAVSFTISDGERTVSHSMRAFVSVQTEKPVEKK